MEISPEVKKQLEEQKKNCIFCKIISGEVESKKVFDDNKTIAVLDINPIIKGHTLFLTKEHYPIMPYIPADEFKQYFGIVGQLANAVQKAMIRTGNNIFVANGYAAGQQAPHFMLHLMPREGGDGFFNFLFKPKHDTTAQTTSMLTANLPIMMRNHFGRNPAVWHTDAHVGSTPSFLENVKKNNSVVYEDEKVIAIVPTKALSEGHIEIYSKEEEKNIGNLSQESCAHIFYVASFAATAVFEGLKAQATNIIVKSGTSDDNPTGELVMHVFPRSEGDSLKQVNWEPKQPTYDLDSVVSKIKDKAWVVKYKGNSGKENIPKNSIDLMPKVIKIGSSKKNNSTTSTSSKDEIKKAIERMHK
jgi:histidine triad (HIT) family protein